MRISIHAPSAAIGAGLAALAGQGQFFSYGMVSPLPYVAGLIGICAISWVGLRKPSAPAAAHPGIQGVPDMLIENGIDGWLSGFSPWRRGDEWSKVEDIATRNLVLQISTHLPRNALIGLAAGLQHMQTAQAQDAYWALEEVGRRVAAAETAQQFDAEAFLVACNERNDAVPTHASSLLAAYPGSHLLDVLRDIRRLRREIGPIPPAMLSWMKRFSPRTWQAIDDLDRPSCHPESAGILAHLMAEDLAGARLIEPDIRIAVAALRQHVEEGRLS